MRHHLLFATAFSAIALGAAIAGYAAAAPANIEYFTVTGTVTSAVSSGSDIDRNGLFGVGSG
jgi:hypothetical protein